MSNPCQYAVKENIAILTLDLPPVNNLSLALRKSLKEGLEKAGADDSVQAIILTGNGKLFCAGADISEFATGELTAAPMLPEVYNGIDASPKLVVAAVNGMALGGGCELALACDYRIAHPAAKLGLPEVHLGLLPGAGGTQRLPRIGGVELALNMITSGKPEGAAKLAKAGVVDRVAAGEGGFVEEAVAYAKTLLSEGAPKRSCAEMKVDTSVLPENYFADFRAALARRTRGFYAPERCIQAVEAACELPLAEGLKKEADLFMECLDTPQARAQQHVFFSEREVTKIPGLNPKEVATRDIKKVGVIGSGTMGGGIAMNYLNTGTPVIMLDLDQSALDRGIGVIRKNYEITAKKGRMTQEQVEERMTLLQGTVSYDDLADVDLVIEAVFEKMSIKKTVFETLDKVCKPGAILATNTSTLDVDAIAATTQRPQDVIGLHFFSPANVMKLLEVVRGAKTADDVLLTCIKMGQAIGKTPVTCGVCWGFVGNRATDPYLTESLRMILEGATPAQIDRVQMEFGMPMGVPSMADMAGLDVGILTREDRKAETVDRDPSYWAVAHELFELGRYGQKTGRGCYIYEGREKTEDSEVMEMAKKLAKKFGVEQRELSDQEIIERSIFPLINEGARILEEGIAYRSSDIDIILAYGFGFPVYRGGPMQYADEIGLDTVLAGLKKFQAQSASNSVWYEPAPLLEKLAAEGKTFASYGK